MKKKNQTVLPIEEKILTPEEVEAIKREREIIDRSAPYHHGELLLSARDVKVSFNLRGAELARAGVEFTLTTDHDVCALWMLPYFAGLAVREGLDEQAAFRAITLNGAKVCGIEDRVGSIKVGKDADIVVYNGHPFHYLTKTRAVFIDGKQVD